MRISLKVVIGVIGALLFLASLIAVYFAVDQEDTAPLLLVALVNVIAVFTLLFLITRGILPSLQSIQDILRRVGKGDLKARVKIDSVPELNVLADYVNEMAANVEQARKEVEAAKQRAEEIERLKTEFVSLAAHQLRTPLSAIKWTLKMLLDGDVGELDPGQRKLAEKTYIANERMVSLITDLLNVTRIEEGRYLYQPVLVHVSDMVKPLVATYDQQLERGNLTLELNLPEERLPKVLADKEKLTLAVQNLIDNALRYTPEGGTITVTVTADPAGVQIIVKDDGMGIPVAQQNRVFEKFFRATNAKRVDTDGTGLGLYLVKNIVEAHGGTITFVSKEEEGTTFTITLPLQK